MTVHHLDEVLEAREIREEAAAELRSAAGPVSPVVARSIRDIPHACTCDWQPPDYRVPPQRRAWTLPAADPQCRRHGTPKGEEA